MISDGFLVAPSLEDLPGVVHAFSLALRSPEDHAAFARSARLDAAPILRLRQVHGAAVVRATRATPSGVEGDALVTNEPGVAIGVAAADCVPVLFADPRAGVVAAAHAGWRGMRSRVILRAVEAMAALGAEPAGTRAAVGPAIQGSCYEVGPEVRAEYDRHLPGSQAFFTDNRLDLVRAARAELARAGLSEENVATLPFCTHCRPELSSFRREGSARGTNLAVIALRPPV